MGKYQKGILLVVLVLVSGTFSYWLYMNVFFFYAATLFRELYYYFWGEYWVPLFIILLMTFFLSSFLYQLLMKRYSRTWINFFYVIYAVCMLYLLFFKNISISGTEWNLLSFVGDFIYGDRMIVVLNVIMFIPLGLLLPFSKKNSAMVLFVIFLIESLQLILHLGFFDLGDIVTNFTGYLIGAIIASTTLFKSTITKRITN